MFTKVVYKGHDRTGISIQRDDDTRVDEIQLTAEACDLQVCFSLIGPEELVKRRERPLSRVRSKG
jgi:hypothetical protein